MQPFNKTNLRRFVLLRLTLLVLLFLAVFPFTAFSSLRIMQLGDSITYGLFGTYGGYRGYLFDRLNFGAYDFDFVGSRSDNSPGTIDPHHEGHPGWRAERIRDNVNQFLINNPAEVVLLHIGTNDMSGIPDGLSDSVWKSRVQAQVAEVSQILDNIDDFSKNTIVILALIISRTDEPQKTYTSYFNQKLNQMAEARTNDDIIVVDMENEAGLVYSTAGDLGDYLHPNDSGYEKMADVWISAIDSYNFNANCRLDSRFQTDVLGFSTHYYTDRDYTLTNVPTPYLEMETITTPNDDRNRTDASSYLKFEMPYDATVYVAYDSRATSLPNWLRSFTYTGYDISTSLSTQPSLNVYGKPFSAGDCVNLGANKATGFAGDIVSNYIVFYGVAGAPPACVLNPKFDLGDLTVDMPYYTDRDYWLTNIPAHFIGLETITTPNEDRNRTDASSYLTFEMPYEATVYVAYDSRAPSLPNWLRSFTYTGYDISTSLSTQPYLKVYGKPFSAGDCVNLGANKATGFAGDIVSNYIVFYGVAGAPPACVLDPKFGQTSIDIGVDYYTDRDYTITGGVPDWMIGRTLIKTVNDERSNGSSSGYVRFTNPVDWWVYVLFDSRSSSIPNWLTGWELRSEKITTSLGSQPYLKVYRKQFAAGQCVDLGGNYGPNSSIETRSNYAVVYGK